MNYLVATLMKSVVVMGWVIVCRTFVFEALNTSLLPVERPGKVVGGILRTCGEWLWL